MFEFNHNLCRDIGERYNALKSVAEQHALVSFGLTIFENSSPESDHTSIESSSTPSVSTAYIVHNFNFLLLSMESHQVSPSSLSFLVDNGFDFNRQYREGIPYQPGDDPVSNLF